MPTREWFSMETNNCMGSERSADQGRSKGTTNDRSNNETITIDRLIAKDLALEQELVPGSNFHLGPSLREAMPVLYTGTGRPQTQNAINFR